VTNEYIYKFFLYQFWHISAEPPNSAQLRKMLGRRFLADLHAPTIVSRATKFGMVDLL